ncbi:hypothetical protein PRUPE_3G064000 [Prunus persica]|uniref:Uncharacterized protein n=1 Tax=Prunus persica TaxID=3760 RepID=A0A251PWH4_PRUPE|nr:hypothetical protein PRUPE_3G064000 [Prunus persica]
MVCVGVFFGCLRPRSVKGYILSALAIIGILFGLRILCYIVYRCFKREMQHPHSPRIEQNPNDGLEMQPWEIHAHHPATMSRN